MVLLAVIPTRLPSHADRKAVQLDYHESWRCEGSECCSSPPPQRLISLDTVPGRQRSQSFCWISLNMTQREWFSCTNQIWFDHFTWVCVDTYLVVPTVGVVVGLVRPLDWVRNKTHHRDSASSWFENDAHGTERTTTGRFVTALPSSGHLLWWLCSTRWEWVDL